MPSDIPVLVAGARQALVLTADGEIETLDLARDLARAAQRVRVQPHLCCHARALARRMGMEKVPAFDLLELFAFVLPARFCMPTPRGLAEALGIVVPSDLAEEAMTLLHAMRRLLGMLADEPGQDQKSDPVALAALMGKAGWPWAPLVLRALGAPDELPGGRVRAALQVWRRLREWEPEPPEPPPGQAAVEPSEARSRLAAMLGNGRRPAEPRPQQSDYASAIAAAFLPRAEPNAPNVVLAEAGTGTGKTLGYLAPSSLWAERNGGAVWISTYTRNLQHQIDAELDRLYPDPEEKTRKVVVRKGRENYLCLLNLEDAARAVTFHPQHAVALGLMARWAAATRDGDMQGGDFPGWLPEVAGRGATVTLADRRGECVYSACDHYRRCFVEWSIRRARKADIVIANHALVMIQAALGGGDDPRVPTRYVFDEGHHVFDAADNAFSGHLTGREAAELRRWLLGAEEGGRSRARGLKRRLEDLVANDEQAAVLLDDAMLAARILPGDSWAGRIAADEGAKGPVGPAETFLWHVRRQVHARAHGQDSPYSLETETHPPAEGVLEAAGVLDGALERIAEPLTALSRRLRARLDEEADELDSDQRRRIDAMVRSIERRGTLTLAGWRAMLKALRAATPDGFVDWFAIERQDGRDIDVGMHRHHVDPTGPFAAAMGGLAHGMVVTSATLTDGTGDAEQDWQAAEARTGALHLPRRAIRAAVPSPFDYASRTRVLVVNDVRKDDFSQVAAAYRELFLAAGGGALGLFTAISRLRAVYDRIVTPLDHAGVPLYAQHVDGLDVSTLIDIFRGEEHACLLGTDAVRDGVDVPGRSLRLIVFDRVPWPRPDILHRARRDFYGARRYDDMITRLRLKQAFGRLVRRADDVGVFVLLDPMMPSRLGGAFPDGVAIERVGLAEAIRITGEFLAPPDPL